jgi:predicted ATPase
VELGLQLLPIAAEVPLVYVFVTRADKDAPGWKLISQTHEIAGVGAIELHLAPLSDVESRSLVSNLLQVEALPENLRALILAKAEGNPFFVEEVIRMLIDRGGIAVKDGKWAVTREIQNIEIPDTLQGVLTARIDRLSDDAKRTLQIAAVIGRKFQVKVLEHVLKAEGL